MTTRTKTVIASLAALIILWACLMMGGKVVDLGGHIDDWIAEEVVK